MDLQTLNNYAKTFENSFKGIFFKDQNLNNKVQQFLQIPHDFIIINTDTSKSNGEHWILLTINTKKEFEFVDSEFLDSSILHDLSLAEFPWILPSFTYKAPTNFICGEYIVHFLWSRRSFPNLTLKQIERYIYKPLCTAERDALVIFLVYNFILDKPPPPIKEVLAWATSSA